MRSNGLFSRARTDNRHCAEHFSGLLRGLLRNARLVGLPTTVVLVVTFAFYSAPSVAAARAAAKPPTASDTGSPTRPLPPAADPHWAALGAPNTTTGALTVPAPSGVALTNDQLPTLTLADPPPQQAITIPAPKGTHEPSAPSGGTSSGLATPSLSLPPAGGTFAAPSVLDIGENTEPDARAWDAMTYDANHNVDLLFGGIDSSGSDLNDAWTWSGTDWTQQSPTSSPSARDSASIAYDPAISKVVLFGGTNSGTSLGDTWTWDGSNWTQLSPATSPEPLLGAGMDYDPATGTIILFGGKDESGYSTIDVSSKTWSFNGTTWTQLSPTSHPSARRRARMAYDPGIARMVLFAGDNSSGVDVNDTWTFNGSSWTQLSPSTSPAVREDMGFAWDPTLSLMVLYGGLSCTTSSCPSPVYEGDEWAFDGSSWYQGATYVNGGPREGPSLAQDPANG